MKWWGRQLIARRLPVNRMKLAYLARILLIALVYVVTAKFGLSLAFATQQVTTVWPPTGIALVVLLLLGYRYWPGIMLGAFVANALTNEAGLVAGGIAIGNTLEALAGAFLLKRLAGIQPSQLLATTRNVLALLILGALASTLISATIGTLSLAAGGLVPWSHFGKVWPVWWVGDMMGDLIFAPILLCFASPGYWVQMRRRPVEAGAMLAISFVVGAVIFTYSAKGAPIIPFPYMVFPVLIWAALRFTQAGVVTSLLVIALAAVWGTVTGLGTFAHGASIEENLVQLQLFLLTASVTSLLVATVVSGRLQAQRELLKELERSKKLERELQEAHRRATDILAGVLDEESPRRK